MRYGLVCVLAGLLLVVNGQAAELVKQLPDDLTLSEARAVVDAALKKSAAQGVPMNIAVVDAGGNLKAFVREDGAFFGQYRHFAEEGPHSTRLQHVFRPVGRGRPARPGAVRH